MLAIAAAKLGWDPVAAYDHEQLALEAAAANAAANGVELELQRINLRERLPALALTVVANMTAPILRAVASQLAADTSPAPAAPSSPPPAPETLVCSGLLPSELDDVVVAFGGVGLAEVERRVSGDWAGLLLRRG
jgi:ribosomal protein L11 methylase PrmA